MAAAHHERLDGGGYPHALTAAQLTTPTRVLMVADVYEALTSERPYRRAMTSEQAVAVLRAEVPHRLDQAAFSALEALVGGAAGAHAPGAADGGAHDPVHVEHVLDRERAP